MDSICLQCTLHTRHCCFPYREGREGFPGREWGREMLSLSISKNKQNIKKI